jgi:DNA mismatch repair protein MutS
MYDEYRKIYQENVTKYGSQTAIFLMVGAFYELYDLQDTTTGETECNVRAITDLLGIQLTTKKDATPINTVGLFAGIPDYTLHKHAGRLTANGWTVVVVDQVKNGKGKVQKRQISRILSPSTHVEAMSPTETPYVTLLVFSNQQVALASLDLTTATTSTYQGSHLDDIQQHISLYKPKELLVYWNKISVDVRKLLSIPATIPIHSKPLPTTTPSPLANADYLRRIYSIKSLLPVREYLSLRSDVEELALLLLLQFAEEHMPSALKGFQRSVPWIPEQNLVCGNHALEQLQMDSVVQLFNACITPMGKRAIRERLLKPLTHAAAIQQRLEEIQAFQAWSPLEQKAFEQQLRFIGDLPRLHRKVQLATITPQEFVTLGQSYTAATHLLDRWPTASPLQPTIKSEDLKKITTPFCHHITMDKALQASDDLTPFSCSAILAVEQQIAKVLQEFERSRTALCAAASLSPEAIRLESREKEPFGFKASTATLRALQAVIHLLPKGTAMQVLKSGGWIEVPELHTLNAKLVKLRLQLESLAKEIVLEVCNALYEAQQDEQGWNQLEEWLSHIDCIRCIAKVSAERGFVKPELVADAGDAFLDLKGLRHPLVQSRAAYVQHDVQLGLGTDSWLVYGMNASGKSTLMKAVGIATVLAQSGCFVPATGMQLRPFSSLYTRILNHDNLFAGMSSFATEMAELRDILRSATNQTLVLGDELCSGTESVSAMALVSAGIQWLAKRRAKFIFATHLHDLPTLLDPPTLKLKIWHLHVEYDPVSHKLVYDRALIPGSGSTLYGLEVARAMDLPLEFLELAQQQRHTLLQSTRHLEAKSSSYNSLVRRSACEVCHSEITTQLEVHHIEPKASALHGILPSGIPMNDAANLVVLCAACHDKHHANTLDVLPLVQTSEGLERSETQSTRTTIAKKAKWSEEQMAQIHQLLNKYKTASLKGVAYQLKEQFGIEISSQALGAIRRTLGS